MRTPVHRRSWILFHRRMLAAYIVSVLWMIGAIHERDTSDLAFCAACTVLIAVLCHFWTHSDTPSRSFLRH